jgi:hypothetical protein
MKLDIKIQASGSSDVEREVLAAYLKKLSRAIETGSLLPASFISSIENEKKQVSGSFSFVRGV